MAKPTREEMVAREWERLKGLSRLELFDELYGGSSRELALDLMEHYEEELDTGGIVPCADCGVDCYPENTDDKDAEWYCPECQEKSDDDR